MRCSVARDKISRLTGMEEQFLEPSLSSHLEACPGCAQVLRNHRRLLVELESPTPLPDFRDMGPGIVARLGARPTNYQEVWRWAALAAMALAAMVLGYFIGLKTPEAQPEGMAATYQEAFTELPSGSVNLTYFDSSEMDSASTPVRSAP